MNKRTKFSLLENQKMDHKNLEKFIIWQKSATYIELSKMIADYKKTVHLAKNKLCHRKKEKTLCLLQMKQCKLKLNKTDTR